MKNKIFVSVLACIILSLACNMPSTGATSQPSGAEPTKDAAVPTATKVFIASPTVEPTPTFPPIDITFSIDCSALEASRQTDCDAYITTTRDNIYPLLREITGVSLSECFKNINYTILAGNPSENAGGYSDGSEIVYAQEYSIDQPGKYDIHELLHSFSHCSRALDQHIFHGMIMNAVHARLGGDALNVMYDIPSTTDTNNYLKEAIKTSSGANLIDQCRGILGNEVTLAYFQVDENAIRTLYRATIDPQPASPPNDKLKSIWKESASQVQALLDTLEQQYKYPIEAVECGY